MHTRATLGTHEIGGLTSVQVLEIIRGCRGLNIVGGDVTEVNSVMNYIIIQCHKFLKFCPS